MNEIFATRADWLVHAVKASVGDIIRIHPRNGLTLKQAIEALAAQKIAYVRPGQPAWQIREHGTSMFLYRLHAPQCRKMS